MQFVFKIKYTAL
jgi:outer membrane biosynthesis protein TonB